MEIERCRCEIAAVEAKLIAGNPDVDGLILGLADWNVELRILQRTKKRRQAGTRRRVGSEIGDAQLLME
jgi:hypothetical protein